MSARDKQDPSPAVRLAGVVLCGLAVSFSATSAPADVPIKIVDTVGAVAGTEVDSAFGPDDELAVSYWRGGYELVVARVACGDPEITTLYTGDGQWASLAIDTDGSPAVAHYGLSQLPRPYPAVCYTWDPAGEPEPQTIGMPDSYEGQYPVLALDSVDRPYIAFENWGGGPMPYSARFDIPSGQWVAELVGGPPMCGSSARGITIGLNSEDEPVVAYFSDTGTGYPSITVSTLEEGGWSARTFDTSSMGGVREYNGISLAFDSVDAPHVAFVSQPEDLVVLRFNILSVTSQVAVSGMVPRLGPSSMNIDGENRIRIAFANWQDSSVYLADNHLGWSTQVVDSMVSVEYPSLAVDSQGNWAIAYADDMTSTIKVAGPTVPIGGPGDFDCDGDVDLTDYEAFESCLTGPGPFESGELDQPCTPGDFNDDDYIDLYDFAGMQAKFTGP